MNYNETTIANKLTSNNINIRTGNNLNSVSTIINDTTIDTVDTLINIANNSNNNTTKLNLNIGNGIGIALAEEKHEHEHIHDTWGGDIGRAALGGAITGLASGIGIKGGEYLGNMASTSITTNSVLSTSINASVNAATMSTMNTVGTAMSNTTIYGGNFKDVLKSGRDSLRDKDNLKSIAVSTLGAGITTGLSKYIDGKFNNVISKGTMQGASFKDQTFSALLENGLSNSVNVALESSISGDSFKESLKRQGLNMLSGTIETLGAKYIGNNYHNNEFSDNKVINKTTQLTLHAGLGAITSKISGGDYLNGAVSGVVGEVVGELVFDKLNKNSANSNNIFTTDQFNQNKEIASNIAGLFSGLSSIIVSKSQGQDIEDITTNAYVGQRIGQNAAKYNSTNVAPVLDDKGNVVKDKYRVISADKDGDRSIYNMASGGEKIGETLFDNDYVGRENDIIDFDTKIGRALGSGGLYGDNAEEMVGALINFEIGSLKNNEENYPYVDYLGIMTTGIGININSESKIQQVDFLDGYNNIVKNNSELFYELSNIRDKYTNNENNYEIKNGVKQLKFDIINEINEDFKKLNYKITEESKYKALVNQIRNAGDSLNRQFSNYDNIPTSSKMGLINMIYNLGEGTFREQYKKLSNAVNNENWTKAGDESKIYNIQKSRNEWNKNIIKEGNTNNTNIINNYRYKDYVK